MNNHANITLIEIVSAELRDMLGDDFDSETFLDTLDGETDALDILDRLIEAMQADKATAAAIKAQEADLAKRRKRFEARDAATKKAMLALLDATGEKKIERPCATVSRRSGSLSVAITDETAVPSQLCKTVTTPDKAAIRAQIEAGEIVPGAELVRGADGVTVRVA